MGPKASEGGVGAGEVGAVSSSAGDWESALAFEAARSKGGGSAARRGAGHRGLSAFVVLLPPWNV